MCDESIASPLKIIFDTALKSGIYPEKWKKANVVSVHKKESKNILKNYRRISLLPVCGKIFVCILIPNLMIYYPNLSQIFVRVILVYHSYLQ